MSESVDGAGLLLSVLCVGWLSSPSCASLELNSSKKPSVPEDATALFGPPLDTAFDEIKSEGNLEHISEFYWNIMHFYLSLSTDSMLPWDVHTCGSLHLYT